MESAIALHFTHQRVLSRMHSFCFSGMEKSRIQFKSRDAQGGMRKSKTYGTLSDEEAGSINRRLIRKMGVSCERSQKLQRLCGNELAANFMPGKLTFLQQEHANVRARGGDSSR